MVRAAVIGAGASGLVMCNRFLDCKNHKYEVVVYEKAREIGGTWVYTEATGNDEYGYPIHSSMYDNLHTNLPKELMAYIDYPFPNDGSPSYLTRQDVLQYLHDYCDHYGLQKYIKLQHRVVEVKPIPCNRWQLKIENMANGNVWLEEFDVLAIGNGHYATPRYPNIQDLDKFEGEVIHSHDYRHPDGYAGKNVVCLGAGSSGVDIALDISPVANKVVLCHDLPDQFQSPFPDNVILMPMIVKATPDGFTFKNGQVFKADAFVLCTGYEYNFPFLSPECGIEIRDHHVDELYKHMINIKYPTMGFLSIPFTTVPFVVSDVQAQCLAKILGDISCLPTAQEMQQDTQNEMMARLAAGRPPRHFHKFSYMIWEYLYKLEETFGGIPQPLPKWKEMLHDISFHNRSANFVTFRQLNYRITNNHVFYR